PSRGARLPPLPVLGGVDCEGRGNDRIPLSDPRGHRPAALGGCGRSPARLPHLSVRPARRRAGTPLHLRAPPRRVPERALVGGASGGSTGRTVAGRLMSHPGWTLPAACREGRPPPRGDSEMSAAPTTIYPKGRVLVADGVVYVRELEERDPEVARIIGEADDPVGAASQCLRVGARALRAAHVT